MAEVEVELQTERGRLHADVGVEPAALDVGEHVLIGVDDRQRVLLVRDLLAEDVDRRHLPLGVEPADGLACVLQLGPGDVTLGELLYERPRHGREEADDRSVEQRHAGDRKD